MFDVVDETLRKDALNFGSPEFGALAAALAKAQASFPAIARDKEVTVQTRTGGSYTFKYAPLDSILAAVRTPLADNGLAISQMLDGDDLVTMLLHSGGGFLKGSVPIPHSDGGTVQALGSAITYLRRYSLQAVLGIAAEEDDDGNRASGNTTGTPDKTEVTTGETLRSLGAIERAGAVAKGGGRHSDLEWRQTPDGYHIGFLLEVGDGKAKPQVSIEGPLAVSLFAATSGGPLFGMKVNVKGELWEVTAPQRRKFYRIVATGIETDEWILPAHLEAHEDHDAPIKAAVAETIEDDLSGLPDEWKAAV